MFRSDKLFCLYFEKYVKSKLLFVYAITKFVKVYFKLFFMKKICVNMSDHKGHICMDSYAIISLCLTSIVH